MNKPTASKFVRIPAQDHLNKYLPYGSKAVADYARLMRELGLDISKLGPRAHLPVEEDNLMGYIERLADSIRSLAKAYGGAL